MNTFLCTSSGKQNEETAKIERQKNNNNFAIHCRKNTKHKNVFVHNNCAVWIVNDLSRNLK